MRHLVVVLGDQLDPASSALDDFDASRDAIWMAEVAEESTHVWSSKPRIALCPAAMRHFRDAQRAGGRSVRYSALDDAANTGTLAGSGTTGEAAARLDRGFILVDSSPEALRVMEKRLAFAKPKTLTSRQLVGP